jgi:hypothetical protein
MLKAGTEPGTPIASSTAIAARISAESSAGSTQDPKLLYPAPRHSAPIVHTRPSWYSRARWHHPCSSTQAIRSIQNLDWRQRQFTLRLLDFARF